MMGNVFLGCTKYSLKLQSATARQVNVKDQAVSFVDAVGLQEFFGGFKRIDEVPGGFE